MNHDDIASYCLDQLKKLGADKSQCSVTLSEKKELNVETGEMSLFRTTFNTNIGLYVIKDQKSAAIGINKMDKESIDIAALKVLDMAKSSQSDEAHDISEFQNKEFFSKGDDVANMDLMYQRLEEFIDHVKSKYPIINMESAIVDFSLIKSIFLNSNNVNFKTQEGMYGFQNMFTAKEGKNTSSFNGSGFSSLNLNKPFYQIGSSSRLLKQSTEQVSTKKISKKFKGEVLISPDCLSDFLSFITGDISDGKIISKTSIYHNKLNEAIIDSKFTLHSNPISDEIDDGYFLTDDGYKALNSTIIKNGILKTHLLSLYGANKTGAKRAVNDGGAYIVEPGLKSKDNIISNI
ncbi:MAG: peptidase, partial [Euryarchaeota archaeon]|nr:peptidase [Euryarchaeota archaeon]